MFLNTYSLDGRSNEYFERWSPDGASVRNFIVNDIITCVLSINLYKCICIRVVVQLGNYITQS